MKYFLSKLLFFFFLIIPVYILFIILFGTYVNRFYTKNLPYIREDNLLQRFNDLESTRKSDVLILGSSHAYRGYDVRVFKDRGLKSFNLGSSSQTLIQTEFMLQKYYETLKPKFVIIDIYPSLLNSDGVESSVNLVSNAKLDKDWLSYIFKINNVKVYNTAIFAAYVQLCKPGNVDLHDLQLSKSDKYISGGYVETKRIGKIREKYTNEEYKVRPEQLEALQNIVDFLKNKHIPYLLTQAPLYPQRYRDIKNTAYIDTLVSKYGPYINFNNEVTIPKDGFMDSSHMNQFGVDLFNKKLLDTLIQKGYIKLKQS
jgi:hypothetical protein